MERKSDTLLGILQKIAEGFLAGMMISLGGAVFLACTPAGAPLYSKFVGALLFSMALLCICMCGFALYTGKIGLVLQNHRKDDISLLLLCLLGNAIGTVVFGKLIGWVFPALEETANALCAGKLDQGYGFGFLRAVLCGILVYLAIDLYRNNKSVLGIVMCIPAFILSGYEHSIADMFYFACSTIYSGEAFLYLVLIVLGNSVGALLIPSLRLIRPREQSAAEQTEPAVKEEHPTEQTEPAVKEIAPAETDMKESPLPSPPPNQKQNEETK